MVGVESSSSPLTLLRGFPVARSRMSKRSVIPCRRSPKGAALRRSPSGCRSLSTLRRSAIAPGMFSRRVIRWVSSLNSLSVFSLGCPVLVCSRRSNRRLRQRVSVIDRVSLSYGTDTPWDGEIYHLRDEVVCRS